MSKRWIWLLGLLVAFGLVACQSTPTPAVEPTATTIQSEPTATQPRAEATATQAQASAPTATLAAASDSGPTPTPAWQIPAVQEDEWTKGAEDAGLVIVEYSDFQ